MINNNIILLYDLETSGYVYTTCDIWEIAAMAIDPRTLDPVEEGEFQSFVRPPNITDWNEYEKKTQKARDINNISIEDIKNAPEESVVFKKFVDYVKKYTKGHITRAPVAAGFNIINFDNKIIDRFCFKYKVVDKDGLPALFHPRDKIDIIDKMFWWFESYPDGPEKYRMDLLRPYFGISGKGAHRAGKDIEDCALLLKLFMGKQRIISQKNAHKFMKYFAGKTNESLD